jgi:hypothetical protein
MSSKQLRAELQTALLKLATGDLRTSATALHGKLGYASHKTLELPTQPQAFAKEVENLLGGSKQLNPAHASLADWQSAAFLFQLTNDELPALAAGQAGLLTETGGVQAWQVESFVFLALDLKPGTWSRTRLAALTREVNRLFPMPAVLLFRHPREDGTPLLSISVIHRRANKRDASLDVIEGKVSIIKDIDLGTPHAAHLRILESMALTEVDAKYVPSSFDKLYEAWLKALDVKALNDRFYKDLAEWYYWATRKDNEGDGSCELIFSNRSAMSYEDLRKYLLHLKDKPGIDARIDWNAIRPQQVRAVNHDQLAGLQMADAVASSLFFAVNLTQYSEVEDRYFRMLRPTIYRHPKTGELGYGLKFWPGSLESLTESMAHLASFSPPK